MTEARETQAGSGLGLAKLAIDLGPVAVFILTFVVTKNPFQATIVFMIAMAAAMIFSKLYLGNIPVLLIVSGIMVLVFGGLTVYLHDQRFIQMKPSIYYAVVAAILFYGGYSRKPLLKHALGSAYPDLGDHGWHILGRNFAWFFSAAAVTNELLRHFLSFEHWGWSKAGFVVATFLFGAANIPMIMRESTSKPAA